MRSYAELQSKQRATYGDDEEAREAAGKAALLREAAKESLWLSTGWAARLGCEQRRGRACATPRPPVRVRPEAYRKNGVCFRRKRGLVGLL